MQMPRNLGCKASVGLTLGHRLQRLPNINPALVQCLVFGDGTSAPPDDQSSQQNAIIGYQYLLSILIREPPAATHIAIFFWRGIAAGTLWNYHPFQFVDRKQLKWMLISFADTNVRFVILSSRKHGFIDMVLQF